MLQVEGRVNAVEHLCKAGRCEFDSSPSARHRHPDLYQGTGQHILHAWIEYKRIGEYSLLSAVGVAVGDQGRAGAAGVFRKFGVGAPGAAVEGGPPQALVPVAAVGDIRLVFEDGQGRAGDLEVPHMQDRLSPL